MTFSPSRLGFGELLIQRRQVALQRAELVVLLQRLHRQIVVERAQFLRQARAVEPQPGKLGLLVEQAELDLLALVDGSELAVGQTLLALEDRGAKIDRVREDGDLLVEQRPPFDRLLAPRPDANEFGSLDAAGLLDRVGHLRAPVAQCLGGQRIQRRLLATLAVRRQDEQHLALGDVIAGLDALLHDDAGLRREHPQDAAFGDQISGDRDRAGVVAEYDQARGSRR